MSYFIDKIFKKLNNKEKWLVCYCFLAKHQKRVIYEKRWN